MIDINLKIRLGRGLAYFLLDSIPLIGVQETARLAFALNVPLRDALLLLAGRR